MQPDYRLLIDGDGTGRFDRLCALLAQVKQLGSLRQATEATGLSYRYAWGLIRKAEKQIGTPLLVGRVGGAAGGGADLTPAAHELLRRQRLLQQEVEPRLASILAPLPEPSAEAPAGGQPLLMASTIGPVEVGLVDALAVAYRAETGVWIRYIAAGTGQALEVARSGRVDLVLVHAPALEDEFIAEGYGTRRTPLACNAFLLCGPEADPAGVAAATTIAEALGRIAGTQAPFVSRGDRSGTHVKERELWAGAQIEPGGDWYQVYPLGGQGNAATLRHAASLGAYTLMDSATYAMVKPVGMVPLYGGDPSLCNRFSLIPVNQSRFPHVNAAGAEQFVTWAGGAAGQAVVESFGVEQYGVPLFTLPE